MNKKKKIIIKKYHRFADLVVIPISRETIYVGAQQWERCENGRGGKKKVRIGGTWVYFLPFSADESKKKKK